MFQLCAIFTGWRSWRTQASENPPIIFFEIPCDPTLQNLRNPPSMGFEGFVGFVGGVLGIFEKSNPYQLGVNQVVVTGSTSCNAWSNHLCAQIAIVGQQVGRFANQLYRAQVRPLLLCNKPGGETVK